MRRCHFNWRQVFCPYDSGCDSECMFHPFEVRGSEQRVNPDE